jgi:hypothetical protein
VLILADGPGTTHEFLNWLVSQRLSYSSGSSCPTPWTELLAEMITQLQGLPAPG